MSRKKLLKNTPKLTPDTAFGAQGCFYLYIHETVVHSAFTIDHPKFKRRIDTMPKQSTASSFFVIFSRKSRAPRSIVKRIIPTFSVGKNTALGNRPARVVLRRLQHPKNRPTNAADAPILGSSLSSPPDLLLVKRAKMKDTAPESKKAIIRNADFWLPKPDPC